ncbi:MAG: response regulator [Syntrophaceae bacterium]|jgi:DNA-binding response OmpR family regulator|nr:response regulator [Syntrophaceae bacterium]
MGSLKVMLVDDEQEFAITLAERLRMRGIETITAFDGEEALKLIVGDKPDVVVLDIMMPGMSGLQVLGKIAEIHPGIPVILLTGIGSTTEGIAGMKIGAHDYLMKPIQIEELIDKIRAAVKK